jgi:hypothetical protein
MGCRSEGGKLKKFRVNLRGLCFLAFQNRELNVGYKADNIGGI